MSDSSKVPMSELAQVGPPRPVHSLAPSDPVSFIAMPDVSESGEWKSKQTRRLETVTSGFSSFAEGDVLFAKITPCMENGKGCHARGLVSGVGFGSTEFHVLRANPGHDPRFIFHWTQTPALRLKAEAFMIGSAGQRRVQRSFFDHFEVAGLPLPEQQLIASILDTVDEVIRKTEEVIAKLQQMKQGLLHDLLTRGIDDNGELRDPDRHPEQFKDSELGRIPKDWDVGVAAAWCDRLTVGVVNSATHAYRNSGVPFVRSQNVKPNRIDTNDMLFITESFNKVQSKSILRKDDIVIVRTGYPGTAAVVPEELDGANCFSLVIATPDHRKLASEYLARFLNSPACMAEIDRLHFGSAQHNFNVGEMRRLPLSRPPLEEQAEIIARLRRADDAQTGEASELAKLRLLKSGLMDDLLTGRVRVTALLDSTTP